MDHNPSVVLMAEAARDYRSYSLWLDTLGEGLEPRSPLPGDQTVDVAIIGAGYTGLWTAYYLLRAEPRLRVALIEKEIAGFGASGRNGGWCSGLFAASRRKLASVSGRSGAVAMERELFATIDEIGRVVAAERVDADFCKGGTLTLVTSPTQMGRVRALLDDDREWGFGEKDFRWVDRGELSSRICVEGALGARYTPHCARIHPARLARGLARVVEAAGATIYESTAALAVSPGKVETDRGTVRADVVVRATEGYTPRLRGMRRALLPLSSLMVATEPLPREVWDAVGWSGCETIHDGRHLLIYAQRTADGRVAMGGRGAPYRFGSRVDDLHRDRAKVFASLEDTVRALFPAAAAARFTHRWGGPLGVPRDWFSSVTFDRSSGLASAGGYVGDGVATSNLAGRTLTDLILDRDSPIVHLPWVNHRSRRWEPEPLRWLGVNLGLKAMAHADRVEERTGRATKRGEIAKRWIGL